MHVCNQLSYNHVHTCHWFVFLGITITNSTEVATIARETEERMKALCAFIDKLGSINDALAIQQLEVGNHNPYEA